MSAALARRPGMLLALSCVACLCMAPELGTAQTAMPSWDSEVLGARSYADIDARLRQAFEKPFTVHVVAQGARSSVSVDSCLGWLALKGRVSGTEPGSDFAELREQGVQCDALALVKAGRPSRKSALPVNLESMTATTLYPATLWIAIAEEEIEKLSRPGLTLAAGSGISKWKVKRDGLVLEDKEQGVRLVWIARGDFDGDGWEDAMYRWQAWVTGGSWTDMRLVLLTRRQKNARLVEVAPKLSTGP